MKWCLVVNESQQILYSIEILTEFLPLLPDGLSYIEIPADFLEFPVEDLYLKSGSIRVRSAAPSILHQWSVETETWVVDIDLCKRLKSQELDAACKQAIVSGYKSNALGEEYTYPSKSTDQANMIASVTDSYNPENATDWTTPFWCQHESGEWGFRLHTATQIRRAGAAGKAAIAEAQLNNAVLQAQVSSATTQSEIDSITWPTD